jgi:hypothetical protein
VALQNGAVLQANLPATGATALTVVCPPGHFTNTGANGAINGNCRTLSIPKLENNIIWHNSSYNISVGALSPAFQQNIVTMVNAFTGTTPATQATTGQCVTASYWDIGVRGDTSPTNHSGGATLAVSDSVLTPGGSSVSGSGNSTTAPAFVSSYCDGSRTPPEAAAVLGPAVAIGWQVPAGISDATVPNPIFNLTPSATVDEGNNWVNLNWGPLSLTNPAVVGGANTSYGGGPLLGNYGITAATAARVTGANFTDAPAYDFYNNPRKNGANNTDAGAVRMAGAAGHSQFSVSPSTVDFGLVPVHNPTTLDQDIQVINSDTSPLPFNSATLTCAGVGGGLCSLASFTVTANRNTCDGTTIGAGQSCVINVVFNPTSASHDLRAANLIVTAGGISQTVALTGHDTFGTLTVTPPGSTTPAAGANNAPVTGTRTTTPTMTPTPASLVAITGTITLTNTQNLCLLATCPGGSSPDAGPILPTAITLTQLSGAGTFAVGGTCAVGTPINSGVVATPQVPAVPGGSCTITITYTPPVGATATTPGLAGSAHLTVTGYGLDPTTTFINATYNAN